LIKSCLTADTDHFPAKMGSLRIYAGNFVTRSNSLESTPPSNLFSSSRAGICAVSIGGRLHLSRPSWAVAVDPRSQRAVFRALSRKATATGSSPATVGSGFRKLRDGIIRMRVPRRTFELKLLLDGGF
jgi:hypothetical protein